MSTTKSTRLPVVVALAAAFCSCGGLTRTPPATAPAAPPSTAPSPAYDAAFWKIWGDGQAELTGYDLTFSRYGELRKGVAVTVFVTETFSNSLRVKADPGKHAGSDLFPVMKLNLVEDYQTGIYDYNDMTSAFLALGPVNGRPAGNATKVAFGSQEWCGNTYQQLLFDPAAIRYTSHSYFDGEADQIKQMSYPADGISEDSLLLWARGMAQPAMKSGGTSQTQVLLSLQSARQQHVPPGWRNAVLQRAEETQEVRVPDGRFRVEVWSAKMDKGPTRTFYVERAAPHRVVKWETSNGEHAEMLASDRLKYWEMNAEGGEAALRKLGLKRRPPRSP